MQSWWPSVVLGGVIAAFLIFWAGAVSVTGINTNSPHGLIEYWFFRYQTVLAGAFAIGAAAIGAFAVHQQTRQSDKSAAQARLRKARATRAMLPLALSSVMEYAEQCFTVMSSLRTQCVGHLLPSPVPAPPPEVLWPNDALILMRDYVEHADEKAAEALVLLIATLQVQRSRSTEVFRHAHGTPAGIPPMDVNLTSYMIDAAEVYARSSVLFDHAREEEQVPQFGSEDVISALNLLGLHEHDEPSLYERVRRRNWR